MFSTTVKLADLDDFLTPAQECIKPILDAGKTLVENDPVEVRPNLIKLRNKRKGNKAAAVAAEGTTTTTTASSDPYGTAAVATAAPQVGSASAPGGNAAETAAAAQVSLYDCLSCAGCVTSAEAVLIQQQGTEEFLRNVAAKRVSVVSVSAQSRTALAMFYKLSPITLMRKLAAFFKGLGVTYVVDMSASDMLALLEARREFVQRIAAHKTDPSGRHLPMLVSHCPGWVCYAEKVLDPEVIKHMSTAMSGQQIQGRLVKSLLLQQHGARVALFRFRNLFPGVAYPLSLSVGANTRYRQISRATSTATTTDTSAEVGNGTPDASSSSSSSHASKFFETTSTDQRKSDVDEGMFARALRRQRCWDGSATLGVEDVYHCCVMPCYDKKLEATRAEFHLLPEMRDSTAETAAGESLMQQSGGGDGGEKPLGVAEVDVVLGTSEILELLETRGVDLLTLPEGEIDDLSLGVPLTRRTVKVPGFIAPCEETRGVAAAALRPTQQDANETKKLGTQNVVVPYEGNTGSGAFVEDVFRYVAERMYKSTLSSEPLKLRTKRNADFKEVVLELEGKVALRCAMAYGFRNIQNIMRVIKSAPGAAVGGDDFVPHLVEIMACPGGCLNGGCQILTSKKQTDREAPAKDTDVTGGSDPDTEKEEAGDDEAVQMEAVAAEAAAATEARETEGSAARMARIDKMEELLSGRTRGNIVVQPERHPLVRQVYQWLGAEEDVLLLEDVKEAGSLKFVSTFKSLKQMQEVGGMAVPSSLKW